MKTIEILGILMKSGFALSQELANYGLLPLFICPELKIVFKLVNSVKSQKKNILCDT